MKIIKQLFCKHKWKTYTFIRKCKLCGKEQHSYSTTNLYNVQTWWK